jgi:hypothetical protein
MLRNLPDGSVALLRGNSQLERELDRKMIRVPGSLRWLPRSNSRDLRELSGKYNGESAYVVGKGPSLDNIKASDFPNPKSPVICINESIHIIETLGLPNPLYVIQQDAQLKEACQPKNATILLSFNARNFYSRYDNKYIYSHELFQIPTNSLSVRCAIELLKMMGIVQIHFIAFDACVNGETSYAKVIGHSSSASGADPKRFLRHRGEIDKQCGVLPHTFSLPERQQYYFLSACAIVKDEADYIEEWIEYHLIRGVEHFYIYDNNCVDGTIWKLRPYIEAGTVTVISWPQMHKQAASYEDCLRKYGEFSQWIAFIDIDEFLDSAGAIKYRLHDYRGYAGVALHWVFYGGEEARTHGLVTERFLHHGDPDEHVKTIVNMDFRHNVQFPQFHHHLPKGSIVDENLKPILLPRSPGGTASKIWIRHYFGKSREEYLRKANKGRVDIDRKRDLKDFDVYNQKKHFNSSGLEDAARIKQRLKADITLVTATGDRPEAFKLCEQWIKNQSYSGRIQWIVVDDGVTPTQVTMGQHYVRRLRQPQDPAHTLILNLRAAISLVETEMLFFIEDDDYYAPQYLSCMCEELKQFPLVGIERARYYNLIGMYKQFQNSKHSSLCSTALTSRMYTILRQMMENDNPYLDLRLWRNCPYRSKLLDTDMVIGIKGLPGRKGIGSGHTKLNDYVTDKDFKVLKAWVKSDYTTYEVFCKQPS